MRERRKSEERNEGNKESGGRKDERNREWETQREHKRSPSSLREKENKWRTLDRDNTLTAGWFPTCDSSKNEPLIKTCHSLCLRAQASKINSDKIADSVSFHMSVLPFLFKTTFWPGWVPERTCKPATKNIFPFEHTNGNTNRQNTEN